jgi:[acyl-carrier-protein] S-malonyltransferase
VAEYIFLFPGQGSQAVGMGSDLCMQFKEAKDVFDAADSALGLSISEICFNGPDEALTISHNAQPAVTTMNLAVMEVLKSKGITPIAAAGHSLGEYSADCAAGCFDIETAVKLTRTRGELMQKCADQKPGSMAAIIGLDMDKVAEICQKVASESGGVVSVANFNSPSQVVITGEKAAVEAAAEEIAAAGAKRTIPLNVSGPWHSSLMQEAQEEFGAVLAAAEIKDPVVSLYANIDAAEKKSGKEVCDALTAQVTGSVRWAQLVQNLRAKYPEAVYVECGPGKVLKGLLRQIDKAASCYSVECPKSLEAFLGKVS